MPFRMVWCLELVTPMRASPAQIVTLELFQPLHLKLNVSHIRTMLDFLYHNLKSHCPVSYFQPSFQLPSLQFWPSLQLPSSPHLVLLMSSPSLPFFHDSFSQAERRPSAKDALNCHPCPGLCCYLKLPSASSSIASVCFLLKKHNRSTWAEQIRLRVFICGIFRVHCGQDSQESLPFCFYAFIGTFKSAFILAACLPSCIFRWHY